VVERYCEVTIGCNPRLLAALALAWALAAAARLAGHDVSMPDGHATAFPAAITVRARPGALKRP
jgi:hypothetical protein